MKQFGLGLDAYTMARLDRLRACTGESRSRVAQLALSGQGLDHMERQYGAQVARFNQRAAAAGMHWEQYAELYAGTYARYTYPPGVEDMFTARAKLTGRRGVAA